MATDLSNREEQVFEYLKEVLKSEFPGTDLRSDGEFMEMFSLPHVKLFEPLLTYIDRLKLMQSLENAANMTTEEMDEVAASYYVPRKMGNRSVGNVTFVFEDVPSSGTLIIPVGIEATSKSGLRYRSLETLTLTETSLAQFYDSSSFSYRIPVRFIATSPGKIYDAEIGEITELTRGSLPNLFEIVNDSAFTGGTDSETNIELAARIRTESYAPNLGVERGYKRYINSFKDARESLIAGYGHPLMKRDIIGEVDVPGIKFHSNVRDLHWGTKVDVYVRGETPTTVVEYVKVEEDENGDKFALLKSVPVIDIVDVKLYSLTAEFDDPDIDQSSLYITNYALVKEEDFETEGTLAEVSKVMLNDDRVSVGGYVQVTLQFNQLISEITKDMYEGDGRPPTADVKVKEANKKFVYGSLIAGMESSIGLRDSDRGMIRQKLATWIELLQMGDELQFSDLIEPLAEGEGGTESGIVDYIHLPFQFFVSENRSRYIFYCMSHDRRKVIEEFATKNNFLHRIFEKYKDVVTTYDFFDVMHSLTYDSAYEESMDDIKFKPGIWGQMVDVFSKIRHMTLLSHASRLLSPGKKEIGEHEYFSFGETYVYEAKKYVQNDWEKMLLLFWNISKQGAEDDSTKDMYYLGIYILMIMFMLTTDDYVNDVSKLYQFARKLVVSTPIEFEFDI